MIEIIIYKSVNKGTLQGFLDIKVKKWGNFIINDISYFKKDATRWISFPSRQYEKEGVKKYAPYCRFEEPEMMKAFSEIVLKAIDRWFVDHPENDVPKNEFTYTPKDEDMPF